MIDTLVVTLLRATDNLRLKQAFENVSVSEPTNSTQNFELEFKIQ
jgi:hypothetical protein